MGNRGVETCQALAGNEKAMFAALEIPKGPKKRVPNVKPKAMHGVCVEKMQHREIRKVDAPKKKGCRGDRAG